MYKFFLMPLDDAAYRAVAGSLILDSYELPDWAAAFETLLAARIGSEIDVEWALSNNLKPRFHSCATCKGRERVEIEGVGAQTMRDEYDSIDSRNVERRPANVSRLGSEIRSFWQ